MRKIKLSKRAARHHLCGYSGNRRADGLGNKWHRSAGAGVCLQHIDVVVLHSELDIDQSAHIQRLCQRDSLLGEPALNGRAQRIGRQGAGAVARMDASFFDMLHYARDMNIRPVADGIDIHFTGI